MIVLRTRGCQYARQHDGGCTVCGFLNHADEAIIDDDIVAQLDGTLSRLDLDGVAELDLLTLGSFLNDVEISPSLRRQLLARVAGLESIRRVSFESRAEYIEAEELRALASLLGDRAVELGIGLESADDRVRNELVRKGLPREDFLAVVDTVAAVGLRLLVYLLIKPPGLGEVEAIDDAVASARYVFDAARDRGVTARVAFEPVFVCENTPLDELYTSSRYRLVNLWSVVEVIRGIHGRGEVFIGLSDEDLSQQRMPGSCPDCSGRIIEAIEGYNATQELTALERLDCHCRPRWEAELRRGAR